MMMLMVITGIAAGNPCEVCIAVCSMHNSFEAEAKVVWPKLAKTEAITFLEAFVLFLVDTFI